MKIYRPIRPLLAAFGCMAILLFLLSHKLRIGSASLGGLLNPAQQTVLQDGRTNRRSRLVAWTIVVLFVIALAAIGVHLRYYLPDGTSEPFSISGGVSAWPTEFIRLTAVALCAFFLWRAWARNSSDMETLREQFFGNSGRVHFVRYHRSRFSLEYVRWYWENCSINHWRASTRPAPDDPGRQIVEADKLWHEYDALGHWRWRMERVIATAAVFMFFSLCVFRYTGFPSRPIRGEFVWWLDTATLGLLVILFVWLVFSVADATRLCGRFVENLQAALSRYPAPSLDEISRKWGLQCARWGGEIEDWIDIQLIARRTEFINGLIYYPFIILALIVFARSPLFDAWPFHSGLWIVLCCAFMLAIACGHVLRQSAENARGIAIERMTQQIWGLKGRQDSAAAKALTQMELLLQDVREMRRGAFCPFSQQPLVKAMLVPLGSLGSLQLIEYLIALPH